MGFWDWLSGLIKKMPNKIINGAGDFKWAIEVDGKDLLIRNARATAFGGGHDPQDNGETASGVNTKVNPFIMGVALPMGGYGVKSLAGTPIPKMPFGIYSNGKDRVNGAHVVLEDIKTGKKSQSVPVIDLGPSGYTGNAVDLSITLAKLFDLKATATNFSRRMNIKIIDGAKWVANA